MTADLALEILQLAVDVTKTQTTGNLREDATVAATLIEIIRKARQAYEAHTGEPLDPSLIQPEQSILVRQSQQ